MWVQCFLANKFLLVTFMWVVQDFWWNILKQCQWYPGSSLLVFIWYKGIAHLSKTWVNKGLQALNNIGNKFYFCAGSLSSDVKLFFYQNLSQPVPGRVSDNKFTLKASFPPTLSFPSNFLWDNVFMKIFLLVFINTSDMSNLNIFPKFNNRKSNFPISCFVLVF